MDLWGNVDIEEERGFTGNIDQCIRLAQKKIAAGEEKYQKYVEVLQKIKAKRPNYAEGEPPGLSEDVYKRIYDLKRAVREVRPQTPETEASEVNVNAVIEAYRAGTLDIKPGMISYWVDGVQISPLVPHDFKYTAKLAEENRDRAFWGELPGTQTSFAALSVPPSDAEHMHNIWLSVKQPNSPTFLSFPFLEDTGASVSSILQSDLDLLDVVGGNRVFLWMRPIQTAAGAIWCPSYSVLTRLLGQNFQSAQDPLIIPFLQTNHLGSATQNLEVLAVPDDECGQTRLLGPYLREFLFTATAPDGQGNLIVSTNKTGIVQSIPAVQPP